MSNWATGALLSVFGSVCGNLGVNVQKYSLTSEGLKPLSERRTFFKQKVSVTRAVDAKRCPTAHSPRTHSPLSLAVNLCVVPLDSAMCSVSCSSFSVLSAILPL